MKYDLFQIDVFTNKTFVWEPRLGGPHTINQPLMICFIGGFFFWAKFGPSFTFIEGKQG